MNVTVIAPPPFEPVSLQDVYTHLRLDPDETGSPPDGHPDNSELAIDITAARQYAENFTHRSLIQQTLRLSGSSFPNGASRLCRSCWGGRNFWEPRSYIELPSGPVLAVNAVTYFDGVNAVQPVDVADYYITDDLVPQVRFVTGFGWPSTYIRDDAVRVEYVAGYTPAGSPPEGQADFAAGVPGSIKAAILIGVQLLYDNLAPADRAALESARDSLLAPYVIYTVA